MLLNSSIILMIYTIIYRRTNHLSQKIGIRTTIDSTYINHQSMAFYIGISPYLHRQDAAGSRDKTIDPGCLRFDLLRDREPQLSAVQPVRWWDGDPPVKMGENSTLNMDWISAYYGWIVEDGGWRWLKMVFNGFRYGMYPLVMISTVCELEHGPYKQLVYPLKTMIFHSYVNVYQRVFPIDIMISPSLCWLNIHGNHHESNGFIDIDDDDDYLPWL